MLHSRKTFLRIYGPIIAALALFLLSGPDTLFSQEETSAANQAQTDQPPPPPRVSSEPGRERPDAPPPDRDGDQDYRLLCAGMGFQNGYVDGYAQGVADEGGRGRTDFRATVQYEQADRGYSNRWRYFVVYQRSYRTGFARGYNDGFDGAPHQILEQFARWEDIFTEPEPRPLPERRSRQDAPVVLPPGTRVLLILNEFLSTKMNKRGDPFSAEVARDVFLGPALAIPAGSIVEGYVGDVSRPGRVSGKAELNLRFDKLRLRNGPEIQLAATLSGVGSGQGEIKGVEGTYEGRDSHGKDARTIAGGSLGGTMIGGVIGGGKGAGIGAIIGGLAGLAGVLSTRGEDIELPRGTTLEATLDQELRVER